MDMMQSSISLLATGVLELLPLQAIRGLLLLNGTSKTDNDCFGTPGWCGRRALLGAYNYLQVHCRRETTSFESHSTVGRSFR